MLIVALSRNAKAVSRIFVDTLLPLIMSCKTFSSFSSASAIASPFFFWGAFDYIVIDFIEMEVWIYMDSNPMLSWFDS